MKKWSHFHRLSYTVGENINLYKSSEEQFGKMLSDEPFKKLKYFPNNSKSRKQTCISECYVRIFLSAKGWKHSHLKIEE